METSQRTPGPAFTPGRHSFAYVRTSPQAHICDELVRLCKRTFGRGPTKARARLAGDDLLVLTLEDTMTVAERNLVALGQHEQLRETRLFLLSALESEIRAIVEAALGRRSSACATGVDTRRDLIVAVFTLES
jgi:uncharacterized protein YbcI